MELEILQYMRVFQVNTESVEESNLHLQGKNPLVETKSTAPVGAKRGGGPASAKVTAHDALSRFTPPLLQKRFIAVGRLLPATGVGVGVILVPTPETSVQVKPPA